MWTELRWRVCGIYSIQEMKITIIIIIKITILPLEIQHSPESCYGLGPKTSGRLVNSNKKRVEKAEVE